MKPIFSIADSTNRVRVNGVCVTIYNMKKKENNLAFIDGQNLHLGTMENDWKSDHHKFRTYLRDKMEIIRNWQIILLKKIYLKKFFFQTGNLHLLCITN
jgi:hypothetical protein